MKEEPDDYDEEKPLARFKIHEVGAPTKTWKLFVFRDFLDFEPKDGRPYEIDRDEVPERIQKMDGMLLRRVLLVKFKNKNVSFQLSPDDYAAITAWIGPPTEEDLKVALKRRLKWVVPIGILFVIAATPLGQEEWDAVSLTLGLGLITTAWLAKLWPSRNIFLVDSLWFACLAANSAWLLTKEWSWFRFGILVIQLLCIRGGWSEYRRFALENETEKNDRSQEADQEQWER